MPHFMPRQYAGDDRFTALLAEVKCPMPLYQIRPFILGCLAATDVPKVDAILATLWGGEVPAFDGLEQLNHFTGELFALWNELAAGLDHLGFVLSAAPDVESPSDIQRWATLRQEEVTSFLRGLDAGKTDPEQLTRVAKQSLEALSTALHLWSEFDRLIRKQPTEGTDSVKETAANLQQLDQVVDDAIRLFVSEQRRVRLQQMRRGSTGGTYVKAPEPGRNDPCPCGSGKKYKQCCGRH